MNGTFDDVNSEQIPDRLSNDAPWSAVEQRVMAKLDDAAEIFDAAETIHDWDDLDAWTIEYVDDGSAITFEHPSGAWVRISEGSVADGFDVHTSPGVSGRSRSGQSSRRSATSTVSTGA